MTYARDEAVRLVEWALKNLHGEETICLELPFLNARRKADLAVLSNQRLSAIEIKGARDNIQKLPMQIKDYQDMFLDVSVAVAPKHLARTRELVPRAVGIILLGKSSVELVRKPVRKTRLSAAAAVRWLNKGDLASLMGSSKARSMSIEELRTIASETHSSRSLSELALYAAALRNQTRYAAFQLERGANINLDDVQMLSLQQRIRR